MTEQNNLRILVVDDEKSIRSFLKTSLSAYGYVVFEAEKGKEALTDSVSVHPDAIILDLGLPDMEGREVIVKIRKRTKTPIIILSVRDDSLEKIAALDAGADDYLTKPFSVGELLARLKAVMRRLLPLEKGQILRTGKLAVDINSRRVTIEDNQIDLSPTEYDTLKLLLLNSGKVLTHKQILREIWDKSEDYEGILHLLRVTMSNLRSKIEPNPDRPIYILTEPGVGYRLHSDD
ncbi:MAG: response regulator transcription factor [Candidatus Omnitrophica bacterium]|jgi:two-component system KDP operon response regulator KdpE|nr:response regulator transcription factor [Candidatus Omnitrophota bacterium]